MIPRISLWLLLGSCGSLCVWAQRHLPAQMPKSAEDSMMMSGHVLRALSFGQAPILADITYLRAVAQWGQRSAVGAAYTELGPLLERVVALDPQYEAAYLLAGTALTLNGMDQNRGMELLHAGAQALPGSWRVQFLYGFDAYDLQSDTKTAAQALAAAARLPGSPSFLPLVVARLSAQAQDPEVGIALLETLLQHSEDHELAIHYRRRIAALQLEVQVLRVERVVQQYQRKTGFLPQDIETLLKQGWLTPWPDNIDPGALSITSTGQVLAHDADLHKLQTPRGAEAQDQGDAP